MIKALINSAVFKFQMSMFMWHLIYSLFEIVSPVNPSCNQIHKRRGFLNLNPLTVDQHSDVRTSNDDILQI